VGSGTLHLRLHDPAQRPLAARLLCGALDEPQLGSDPTALSVRAAGTEDAATVLAELARAGVAVAELSLGQPSLDEVFLALTGHPAEEATPEEEAA
jgi:ABC-2 type transport system ATP-binding protein